MDFDNTSPTSSPTSAAPPASNPKPTAVVLARNIQKFFQTKADQRKASQAIHQHHRPKHNHHTNHGDHPHNDTSLDVNTVLHDVDLILEGRSVDDGRLLLRGMVADLLKEVDLLRFQVDETAGSLTRVREERDLVNNDYRDRLFSLMLALQNATLVGTQSLAQTSNYSDAAAGKNNKGINQTTLFGLTTTANDEDKEDDASASLQSMKQTLLHGGIVSADEALQLTIQTLTAKIAALHVQATQHREQLATAREQIEDLTSVAAAKDHKITALEQQFTSINKKRHKVIAVAEQKQQQAAVSARQPTTSKYTTSSRSSSGGSTVPGIASSSSGESSSTMSSLGNSTNSYSHTTTVGTNNNKYQDASNHISVYEAAIAESTGAPTTARPKPQGPRRNVSSLITHINNNSPPSNKSKSQSNPTTSSSSIRQAKRSTTRGPKLVKLVDVV